MVAMRRICGSGMTPGPLGIAATRPSAEAPIWMASCASWIFWIQQILTLIRSLCAVKTNRVNLLSVIINS